ncbi:MAG TPA: GNAT family N-acetyltransferase [Oleiagrimonas sp.]|nr:GNAT family N-acetyltransferase [Oleiagrimonas sp.]
MSDAAFRVALADWSHDHRALRDIRAAVFIDEQHVPVELEWDGLDERCVHVLARDADDQPIGTARMNAEYVIGRMAVVRAWRGHGVGAAMLRTLIECARTRQATRVTLHAQTHAAGFYRRFGFVAHGEPFMEAGIRHCLMHFDLASVSPVTAAKTP